LNDVADSYLDLSDWGKGTVWVHGKNLGRFWKIGPQQTLYLPREWLKQGENNIVVFEALKNNNYVLKGVKQPILDKLN
jgi:beta-galactosidase